MKLTASQKKIVDGLKRGFVLHRSENGRKFELWDYGRPRKFGTLTPVATFNRSTVKALRDTGIIRVGVVGAMTAWVLDDNPVPLSAEAASQLIY